MAANRLTGPMPGGGGGSPNGCPCAGAGCADVLLPIPKMPVSIRDTTKAICFLLIVTAVPSPPHAKAMFIKAFLALEPHVGVRAQRRIRVSVLCAELKGGAGKCLADQPLSTRAGNMIRKVIGSAATQPTGGAIWPRSP